MSFSKEKPWLNSEPVLKPAEKQKTVEIQSPGVAAVREAQKAFMKRYISNEGPSMTKHDFETLAAHARAAKEGATEKEKRDMEDLAKTVEDLWKNRNKK
jgi:hypothetical protein